MSHQTSAASGSSSDTSPVPPSIHKADLTRTPSPQESATTVDSQPRGICDTCMATDAKVYFCRKCQNAQYCGKKCQQEAWAAHKSECDRIVRSKKDTSAHRWASIRDKTFLHLDCENTVFQLLFDAFKLRRGDELTLNGIMDNNFLDNDHWNRDPFETFKRFLDMAEGRRNILPDWWNAEKRWACIQWVANERNTSWGYVNQTVDSHHLAEAYNDQDMGQKLRLLALDICGFGFLAAWR